MVNNLLFLFIIPLGFIFFSLSTLKYKDITKEQFTFIKRLYYSLSVFLIVLTIYSINPINYGITNPIGIPDKYWLIIIIFISGILIAIIFDFLIISGTGIKEISFGWAKVTKEEIKTNIELQQNNIDYLTQLIDAEHEVIQNLEQYYKEQKIVNKIYHSFSDFSYEDELITFIEYFYSKLVTIKRVSFIELDDEKKYKQTLKTDYKLSTLVISSIIKNIKNNKSSLIKEKLNYLCIPYMLFSHEKLLIIIQSNDFIFEIEQRFIINLLKIYENYLINEFYNFLQENEQH